MRHIFIGDVHGMLEELNRLLNKLELKRHDQIIFVGDLLDKGPDSTGVVHRVRTLSRLYNVVLVKGNHEDTHERFRQHLQNNISIATQMAAKKPELTRITDELSTGDIEFLNSAVLFHRIPSCKILVVHGGIPESQRTLPHLSSDLKGLSKRQLKSYHLLMRTRFIDAHTGHFISLGHEKPSDPYWADVYDGRFGHVIFGHQPFMEGVKYFKHATGIDTGAVFGGKLTALIVNEDSSRYCISVESRAYANRYNWMKE